MRESRQFTFDEVQRLLLKHAHEQSGRPGEWLYDKVGMSITGQQDDANSLVFTVSWATAEPKVPA